MTTSKKVAREIVNYNEANIKRKQFATLLALCLPVTIACIDVMALGVAIHNIMLDFSISTIKAQWLLSGYTIGTAAFLITAGKLADIYGRRRVLLLGISLFGVASLCAALSNSIILLIMSRFAQGVASAMMMTMVVSIITYTFSPAERGPAIAKWGISLGLGLTLGPLIGGIMTYFVGWRAIFIINVPICLAIYYLVTKFICESKEESTQSKINWLETAILTIILISLATVLSEGNSLGWSSAIIKTLIILFVISTIFFIFIALKQKATLIDFTLFKQRNFTASTFCGFLSYFCMYAWLFVFSVYLQKSYHMTPLMAGLTCTPFSIAFAFGAKFVGKIIQKIENKILIQAGFILSAISFSWMSFVTTETSLWQLTLMFFLFGMSITIINAPTMTLAIQNIPPNKAGISSGIIFTIRWLGGSMGIVINGVILQISTLANSCWTLAALSVLGVICASLLAQRK